MLTGSVTLVFLNLKISPLRKVPEHNVKSYPIEAT